MLRRQPSAARRSMIGIKKARVLPVPVCAVARTSLPSSAGGIADAWTGVGVVKWRCNSFCWSPADRVMSLNCVKTIFLTFLEGRRAKCTGDASREDTSEPALVLSGAVDETDAGEGGKSNQLEIGCRSRAAVAK